ncbi:MAG: SMP-30/gluconolactonase/LRE family protein, partial [Pyrinomonadaceae bacterium]|nr:SMP-30/gluconolactonase/LRE family protein [Pyrinomonadaceae bacterium]
MRNMKTIKLLLFLFVLSAISFTSLFLHRRADRRRWLRQPLAITRTFAGDANVQSGAIFDEPFGVAVAADGNIFLTDGAANRLWRISANDGDAQVITENLNTPSGLALAPDGTLVIADTGSHTIKRFDPRNNSITIIAGRENLHGFIDGTGDAARFNAPVGVAVAKDNRIYVADTYNDSIRVIDQQNGVTTLAGGEQGYADAANGADAQFNTPCGISIAPDSALIIADTGNNRLRRVEAGGRVTTIAGTGEATVRDGVALDAAFDAPLGVVAGNDGAIFVTDAHGSAVRVFHFGEASVKTLISGEAKLESVDGKLDQARVNHPAGVALTSDDSLVVADAGNKLLRLLLREEDERGHILSSENLPLRQATAERMRRAGEPRWPFDPPERTREIAATFGEVRGEVKAGSDQVWFHNGLDIPGTYGETVRAVRSEKILNPLAVESVGTARERVRFPSMGYVHLRVGRDANERELDDDRFAVERDEKGKVVGVRVRRGTRFAAGDALGTLNNQNHIHLIAGPLSHEFNALSALELPGARDTIRPTFDEPSVSFTKPDGQMFNSGNESKNSSGSDERKRSADEKTNVVYGDVRIVVRAFDSMEGSAARRKLGVYKLGYQVLLPNG